MKSRNWIVTKYLLALVATCLLVAGISWAADDTDQPSDIEKRLQASADVLNEIMGTPDKAIPDKVMRSAK